LSVEEARGRILARIAPLGAEQVTLEAALGRFLAEPVAASRDQPPFAAAAMDGWAVRGSDGPGRLRIIGESAAGHGFVGALSPGEAVRIFTGAVVPRGADAVVIQEDAAREGDHVAIPAVTGPSYVRPAGQDFQVGDVLLAAGDRLDPWRLALAAAAGRARLSATRRPRVAVLSTGDEVVAPGEAPGPFQIFNSGSTALCALIRTWGGDPVPLESVGDSLAETAAALAGIECDLVVTLGGASVGDHDLVKPALATLGLELIFESVAVRPGKPTWFGLLGDGRRVLGLPGNPASALVCAELFLRSALFAFQGGDGEMRLIPARSAQPLGANGGREQWMRGRLTHSAAGALMADALSDQDSALVAIFAKADVLIRRPVGAPAIQAGDPLEIWPLARL
jgi:molybdopterin molybdotransferase